MSSFFIALIFSIGVSGWLYGKLARSLGSDNDSKAIVAMAFVGLIVFFVVFSLMELVLG